MRRNAALSSIEFARLPQPPGTSIASAARTEFFSLPASAAATVRDPPGGPAQQQKHGGYGCPRPRRARHVAAPPVPIRALTPGSPHLGRPGDTRADNTGPRRAAASHRCGGGVQGTTSDTGRVGSVRPRAPAWSRLRADWTKAASASECLSGFEVGVAVTHLVAEPGVSSPPGNFDPATVRCEGSRGPQVDREVGIRGGRAPRAMGWAVVIPVEAAGRK
jgi:hypothetical protein